MFRILEDTAKASQMRRFWHLDHLLLVQLILVIQLLCRPPSFDILLSFPPPSFPFLFLYISLWWSGTGTYFFGPVVVCSKRGWLAIGIW